MLHGSRVVSSISIPYQQPLTLCLGELGRGEGRNGTYIHFSRGSQAFPTFSKICELCFFFFLFGDTFRSWGGELAAPPPVVGDGLLGGERQDGGVPHGSQLPGLLLLLV